MKERILYDEEFEKQLKEKADQFKMYPSDKVWNEVYSSLHTRRRRFVAGMAFLIGGILILAGTELFFPAKNTAQKTIAANIAVPAKPASTDNLRSFTPNDFSTSPSDISEGPHNTGPGLNMASPFVLSSALPSRQPSHDILESADEKIPAGNFAKPIQADDLKVSVKSATPPAVPPPCTPQNVGLGNTGRNQFRGPGYIQNNVSLFKSFNIYRESSLETRIEAFQLSNTPQFNNPNSGSISAGNFGQVTSTLGSGQGSVNGIGGGRSLQASVKFSF